MQNITMYEQMHYTSWKTEYIHCEVVVIWEEYKPAFCLHQLYSSISTIIWRMTVKQFLHNLTNLLLSLCCFKTTTWLQGDTMQAFYHNIFLLITKNFTFHYMQRILIVRELCNSLWYIFIAQSLRDLFEDLQELDFFSVSLSVMLLSP